MFTPEEMKALRIWALANLVADPKNALEDDPVMEAWDHEADDGQGVMLRFKSGRLLRVLLADGGKVRQ
jgi:hypothetical protein